MTSSTPPKKDRARVPFWSQIGELFRPPSAAFVWTVIGALAMVLVVAFGWVTKGALLEQFTDAARARGLITLAITFGTIFFALILIIQAFAGQDASEEGGAERFRRAREVFTVFTGILGTIVGFYFGSAERQARAFAVSGARIVSAGGGALVAQVENGTPPYHYRITFSDRSVRDIERDLASPGWIFEPFEATTGVVAFLTVTDDARDEATAKATFTPAAETGETTSGTSTPPTVTAPTATPPATR